MNASVVAILLLVVIGVGGFLRERLESRAQILIFRLCLGAATAGLGAAALWGSVAGGAFHAALWVLGGMIACGLPLERVSIKQQLPGLLMAAGPLVSSIVLASQGWGLEGATIFSGLQAGLFLATGTLLGLSLGLLARGAERLESIASIRNVEDSRNKNTTVEVLSPMALPMAAGAVAVLAFRRLASLGPDPSTLYLPVVGGDGQPLHWLTDISMGIAAAGAQEQVGFLILAGAVTCIGAGLLPSRQMSAVASILGGALVLGAVGWIFSLDGTTVELTEQIEPIKTHLARVSAEGSQGPEPRLWGEAPATISVGLLGVVLTMLITAGLTALGAGLGRMLNKAAFNPPLQDQAHRLATRDAFLLATICGWLALGAWLFQGRHVTGLWGPVSAPDHLMTGAIFGMTALMMVLFGVRGQDSIQTRVLRAVSVALGVVLLAGVVGGGLMSAVGIFEL